MADVSERNPNRIITRTEHAKAEIMIVRSNEPSRSTSTAAEIAAFTREGKSQASAKR